MPLQGFLTMIAADMILNVGFNQCINETPFRLEVLASCFLLRRFLGNCFWLCLCMLSLGLSIQLGALGSSTFLRHLCSFFLREPACWFGVLSMDSREVVCGLHTHASRLLAS